MNFRKIVISTVLLAGCSAPAFGQDWTKLETDNLVVYSELKDDDSKSAIKRIILTDYMLRALTNSGSDRGSETKLKIILPKKVEALQKIAPGISDNVGGFYFRSTHDTFFISPGLGTKNSDFLKQANETLGHEYTHHFQLNNFADSYPVWFVEGLAGYVGPTKQDGETLTLGWPSVQRVTALTRSRKWMPVKKMFNMTLRGASAKDTSQLYAKSWLTTHYLMATQDRRNSLAAIMNAYEDDGILSDSEFKAAVGMGFADFDKELSRYFRGGAKTWSIPVPNVDLSNIKISQLSEGDSKAFLAYQNIRMKKLPDKYQKRTLKTVKKLTENYPESYNAQYALAGYHATYSPIPKGIEKAQAFANKYTHIAEAHALLGQAYIRAHKAELKANKGVPSNTDNLDMAIPSLKQAIALDPNNYQAQFAMALVLQGKRSQVSRVRPYLQRAHALAPQVDEITLQMGRNYINARQYDKGIPLLERVARNPHGGATAVRARRVLEKALAQQKQ